MAAIALIALSLFLFEPATVFTEGLERILPGDQFSVSFERLSDDGKPVVLPLRVRANGNVHLPIVITPLKASGLAVSEFEQAITDAYKRTDYAGVTARAERTYRATDDRAADERRLRAWESPIGPGDLILVWPRWRPLTEFWTLRVDGQGNVYLPIVGSVRVGGLQPHEAGKAVTEVCREERLEHLGTAWVSRLEVGPYASVKLARIGIGDTLSIDLDGVDGPFRSILTREVSSNGFIELPLLQDPIRVAGKWEGECALVIDEAYKRKGLMQNAMSSVLRIATGSIAASQPSSQPSR